MHESLRRISRQTHTRQESLPPTSCPNCGAGLPRPRFASDHHTTCDYCGSVVHFGVPSPPEPAPAPAPAPVWSEPLPNSVPSAPTTTDRGGPPLLTRIVLLVISVMWAFPVGLIIGFLYLSKSEPGNRAFGKQVLMIVAVYLVFGCILFGLLPTLGSASGF